MPLDNFFYSFAHLLNQIVLVLIFCEVVNVGCVLHGCHDPPPHQREVFPILRPRHWRSQRHRGVNANLQVLAVLAERAEFWEYFALIKNKWKMI